MGSPRLLVSKGTNYSEGCIQCLIGIELNLTKAVRV